MILLVLACLLCLPSSAQEVDEAIRELVAAGTTVGVAGRTEPIYASLPVFYFYEQRAFAPAWDTVTAERLLTALDSLADDGLRPSGYHRAEIDLLTGAIEQRPSAQRIAAREVMMTDAWLTAAQHLLAGRTDPRSLGAEWFIDRAERDLLPLLESSLAAGAPAAGFDQLRPAEPAYATLKDALRKYRSIEAEGGWPAIGDGPVLKTGVSHTTVVSLRRRLIASGDLDSSVPPSETFDDRVALAVKRFQLRHGLAQDGVVGPSTRAALDVPVSARIDQIIANLERWRWLPAALGENHILVNLASFTLHVVENGEDALSMKIVVGRPYRRTPVMSSRLSHVVFNPAWNVPEIIAATDVLQKVKRDPGYLARNHIRVYAGNREVNPSTVAWSRLSESHFPYRLRQDPGPANALGRIKFNFPNRFNVYLHDSPERELFNRDVRDFSSGCIRLEKPVELATYLLGAAQRATIREALSSARERTELVRRDVPIHILYWTAWTSPDGTLHFRPDIYHRDGRILTALRESAPDERVDPGLQQDPR